MKKETSCGAVIARQTDTGCEILLIRHENYGQVKLFRSSPVRSMREIREETGLAVTLDTGFRAVVTYSPKPGVMKDVVYFAAECTGGDVEVQAGEVTDARWTAPGDAAAWITYENDRDVLARYRAYKGV